MTQSCCPLVLVLPTNTTGTGHPQHSKAPPWTPRCHRLSWKVAPFWSAVRRCTARTHWVSTNFARATFDFTTLQQFYFTFCRIQICESSPSGETFCLFTTHALRTLFSQGFYLQSQNAVVKPQHCLAKRRKTSRPSSKTQRSEMLIRVMMNFAKIKVLLSSLTRCFRASWPGTKKIRHPNPKAWRFVQTNESSTRMTPSLHFFLVTNPRPWDPGHKWYKYASFKFACASVSLPSSWFWEASRVKFVVRSWPARPLPQWMRQLNWLGD